jgi:hypothetical protein
VKIWVQPFCKPSSQNPRIAFTAEASAAWQKPQDDRTGRLNIDHQFFSKESSGLTWAFMRLPSSGQTRVDDNVRAKVPQVTVPPFGQRVSTTKGDSKEESSLEATGNLLKKQ